MYNYKESKSEMFIYILSYTILFGFMNLTPAFHSIYLMSFIGFHKYMYAFTFDLFLYCTCPFEYTIIIHL